MPVNNQVLEKRGVSDHRYTQLNTSYDEFNNSYRVVFRATPRPCFNPVLLREIVSFQQSVKSQYLNGNRLANYIVLSSAEGIFNLGGDLAFFKQAYRENDYTALKEYAYLCIQAIHNAYTTSGLPITNICVVQGDALGGGLECALSHDVIIAEEDAVMGFPEILFNLIPGMGAYNLLYRKVGTSMAEKIITSGKMYSAQEFYEMGLVDILVEKGKGLYAANQYIKKANQYDNAYKTLRKAKRRISPMPYEELKDIVDLWVDSVFQLTEKELRMMQKLVDRQNKRVDASVMA